MQLKHRLRHLTAALALTLGFYLPDSAEALHFHPDSVRIAPMDSISDELRNYVPALHAEIIQDRLKCIQGHIKLTYHKSVMNWIEVYAVKQRLQTQTIIERSSFYFPIFEEILRKHNMPDELKYLAIVESALSPKAASWAAAVGLWQFIPATGREYGLQQDWFIDERMDIYKSTDAACRYLKFLYEYHGDWQLALAAYNCGPGRVNWAVKQAGGKNADFWTIYNYLPHETRGYVPAFIAVNYVMNYNKEHFIFPKNPEPFIPSDTVHVSQFVNIEEFAKQIDVPKEHLEKLNPQLKKNAVPANRPNYPLRVPAHKKEFIAANRRAILNASNRASRREMLYVAPTDVAMVSNTAGKVKITHTVASGEAIGLIALRYGTSAYNIRLWNRMAYDMIFPGQKLDIWVPQNSPLAKVSTPAVVATAVSSPAPSAIKSNESSVPGNDKAISTSAEASFTNLNKPTATHRVHVIRSGDNLWDISRKYGNVDIAKIKQANKITERTMLQPGMRLVIPN